MLPNFVHSLLTKNAYAKPATSNSCLPSKPAQFVIIIVKPVTTVQLAWPVAQSTLDSRMLSINASAWQDTTTTETSCVSNAISDAWLAPHQPLVLPVIQQPETLQLCLIVYAWLGSGTMESAVRANRVWPSVWHVLMETGAQVAPQTKSWPPQRIVYACHEHTHQTVSVAITTAKNAQIQPLNALNATEPQWDI